jgi:hypothetical protein
LKYSGALAKMSCKVMHQCHFDNYHIKYIFYSVEMMPWHFSMVLYHNLAIDYDYVFINKYGLLCMDKCVLQTFYTIFPSSTGFFPNED